jgi:hypothetical protein
MTAKPYDVVVVGARCAGPPTATQFAAQHRPSIDKERT